MGIPKTRRGGGPRTPAGKAACASNALKSGIAALRWLNPQEEQHYQNLLASLRAEFPDAGPSIELLIERVAWNSVRLARVGSNEDALFSMAQQAAARLAEQRLANSEDGFWPATDAGRALAKKVLCLAAMPDLHTMDRLEGYRLSLERQICSHLDKIVQLYDRRSKALRASDDISDVQPKPLP